MRLRGVAVAGMLVVGLASCGDEPPSSERAETAAGAGQGSGVVRTARVEIIDRRTLAGQSFSPRRETGVIDFANRRASLTFTRSGVSSEKRRIGSAMYVNNPGLAPRPWMKSELGDLRGGPGGPAVVLAIAQTAILDHAPDPAGALDYLESVSDKVTRLGEHEVRGVPTLRYRATADLKRAAAKAGMDANEVKTLDKLGTTAALTPTVELWIDDDGRVRRMRYGYEGQDSQVITQEFYDFGIDVDVDAPPADQVVSVADALQRGAGRP